jgi:hypothetical protein
VANPHAFGDGVAQALVGGGGGQVREDPGRNALCVRAGLLAGAGVTGGGELPAGRPGPGGRQQR